MFDLFLLVKVLGQSRFFFFFGLFCANTDRFCLPCGFLFVVLFILYWSTETYIHFFCSVRVYLNFWRVQLSTFLRKTPGN